jgi:tetratricopeptide (TPR) repeat protein
MPEAEKRRPTDEAGIEDDFLYHLYRGGELLAGGQNQEARNELERAFHLKPGNQKAQNLLGLVYFKLGLLERSAEIYEMLVHDNPTDPTLRVNLGLVHLKAGEHDRAIRELEKAVDLSPDPQKPLRYLGLAYTQARQHAKALSAFQRAGDQAMVEKMEKAVAAVAAREQPAVEPPPPAKAAPVDDPIALPGQGQRHAATPPPPPPHEMAAEDVAIEVELDESLTPIVPVVAHEPEPRPVAVAVAAASIATATSASASAAPPFPTGALGELFRSAVADLGGTAPFYVGPDGALIRIEGELHARLTGLCWLRGEMQRTPEQKRFRGRATDKPFGEGKDRLYALGGRGEIFVATPGLKAIELGEAALYLLEDALFAFEDSLGYENGRVSSPVPPDLFLVHLRGQGKALLRVNGPLRSLPIRLGEPLVLPMERLVGWTGGLTPSVLAELGAPAPGQPGPVSEEPGRWLRLEGEGWALWTVPPPK